MHSIKKKLLYKESENASSIFFCFFKLRLKLSGIQSISSTLHSLSIKDSAEKSLLVGDYFKGMEPAWNNQYARNANHIANLILEYTGDVTEKMKGIYDRVHLQKVTHMIL